jgi:hypothetical protein
MGVLRLAAAAAAVLLVLPSAAFAQAAPDESALAREGLFRRDRNVSVRERPHPEWAPRGVRLDAPLGGFILSPSLRLSGQVDDNLYATPGDQTAAVGGQAQATVLLRSDFARHALTAHARADLVGFAGETSEARADYALGVKGRLEASRALGIAAGAEVARESEPRTDPDAPPLAQAPIRYGRASAHLSVARGFNRLRLSAVAETASLRFEDGRTQAGARLDQSVRDRTEIGFSLRAEYAAGPGASLFVTAAQSAHRYRFAAPGEPIRSSHGARVELGSNFDLTRLVRGELALGYVRRDYGGRFPSIGGATARARVAYFPTQLTTFSLETDRRVEPRTFGGAAGALVSTAALRADHELYRNVVLSAAAGYAAESYRGVDRRDTQSSAMLAARYLLNRGLALDAEWRRLSRRSSGRQSGRDFASNRVGLGLTLRY